MGIEKFESKGLQGREELVQKIKEKAGELDDLMMEIPMEVDHGFDRIEKRDPECHRLTAMARTQLELSIMCAVKAVSRS